MTDTGTYASRAAALRDTAKWLAATFAGAGAVLFSALSAASLSKVAELDDWYIPVAVSALPVVFAAYAVGVAAGVITQDAPAVDRLLPTFTKSSNPDLKLREELETAVPTTLGVHHTIDAFEQVLIAAHARLEKATNALDGSDPRQKDLDNARANLFDLQGDVTDLVTCADFLRVRKRYRCARWKLLASALAAVAATALASVVSADALQSARAKANPSSAPALTYSRPLPVQVFVADAKRNVTTVTSADCALTNGRRALAVGGSTREPLLLVIPTPQEIKAGGRCARPWLWTPPAGEVVAVPLARSGGWSVQWGEADP